MKKYLISILVILSTILLLFLFFYHFNGFVSNQNNLEHLIQSNMQFCLENNDISEEQKSFCDKLLSSKNYEVDFFTTFSETFVIPFNQYTYFIFLIIIIPPLLFICRYFKNKIIFNDMSRQSFRKIKNYLFKNAYKSLFLLPLVVIIGFIFCYLYTKSFDSTYAILNGTTIWSEYSLMNPCIFIILYIFNVIIHSVIYINISLCIARKHHSFFPALILSFLCFIGIESVLEIFFGGIICTSILKVNHGGLFNIMNMFTFNDTLGILSPIVTPALIMIVTFIILKVMYSDKEKLLIDIEKNDQKE